MVQNVAGRVARPNPGRAIRRLEDSLGLPSSKWIPVTCFDSGNDKTAEGE